MTHLQTFRTPVLALGLLSGATGLWAQSTVAELTAQGGSVLTKAQWLELLPLRIETQWPNRQGEEELFLSTDGKITGKGYHYSSRSESAASGSWRVEDDGKVLREIKRVVAVELALDAEIDKKVRAKLASYTKQIVEGSPEWDVMYRKTSEEEQKKRVKP